jgi:DNA repair exonuclease SbcCD nuclease subunit
MNSKDLFKSNRICCISDIHIGVHQNGAQWHEIVINWAKWLHNELINKGIEDIIISGDLFHYRDEIAVNTIQVVTEVLNIWKPFNIGILVGNHDSYYKDKVDVNSCSILSGWSNITIFSSSTTIEHKNKKLTFCPWGTELYEIPDDSDIIFGHFEIETFKLNEFKTCIQGIKSKDLLDKCDLIITGHFHLREERKYKNGTILYLGNPFQMDFGDTNSTKGYYILDINNKTYEFTENKISPKHIKLKLSDLVKQGKLTNDIKNNIENNILRFIIDKPITSDEVDIILKKFSSLNPLSMNVDYAINFDKFGLPSEAEYDLSGVDITTAIKEFVNILEIDDKDTIVDYTMDLYTRSK